MSLLRQPWERVGSNAWYHGVTSIQNHDNHVALVDYFFELAEKRTTRLLGGTIFFESLRLLIDKPNIAEATKLWSSNFRFFSNCSVFI